MLVKLKDRESFLQGVWGGDCLLGIFPELETKGIELSCVDGVYYGLLEGKIVHDSAFFTEEELHKHLDSI